MAMFFLKELPSDDILARTAERFPTHDPSAMKAFLWTMRTGSDLLMFMENLLKRWGISQGRYVTLIVLYREDEPRLAPSVLAEKAGVNRATMTGLIDGLERDGFVRRSAHGRDRRRVDIVLTDKGRAFIEQLMPEYFALVGELMADITETERESLARIMKKLNLGIPKLLAVSKEK